MIKCVIFDCDGTLVDSEYLCNLGLELKLREIGIVESAEDMMVRFQGGKLATILESLETKHNVKFDDSFSLSYRSLVEALFEKELKPCIGVKKAIQQLDFKKCVASSGPINKIEKALSITGLLNYFNGNLFSSYEIGSWKPDPGIFLHAAKMMGFKPDECVVVEDSPVGIEAAKAAGMHAVLYDPNNKHMDLNCTAVINDMMELSDVIT